MRKRTFHLSEHELEQFRQTEQKTRDAYELRRLQGVRLYGSGESMGQIQGVTQAAERTIREWVQRYQAQGLGGLASQWQGNNANKLTVAQRRDLTVKLDVYTPDQVIAADERHETGVFWTVSDLQIVVSKWYGVRYRSLHSYYHLLHASGFTYQKTEKVYRSRPSAVELADFEDALEKK